MAPTASSTIDHPASESGVQPSLEDHAADSASDVQADEATPSTDPDKAAGTTDDTADDLASDLISDERFDALKDDPGKLRKELNRAATKRFQRLSRERKSLGEWSHVKAAYERDPVATITAVAKDLGLEIRDPKAVPPEQAAAALDTSVTQAVKEALGPEYEELADRLAPAIRKVTETIVSESTKPIRSQQEDLIRDSALRESEAVLAAFGKSHPEWKDHEEEMVTLSKELLPGPGMSEATYLERLYFLVTKDQQVAEAAKTSINRMKRAAETASKEGSTVAGHKVAERPAGLPTFKEAARAAAEGRRLE